MLFRQNTMHEAAAQSNPTLEWFTRPGLGDGELEFVDVGVVPSIAFEIKSSSIGEVANKLPTSQNITKNLNEPFHYNACDMCKEGS